MKDVIAIVLAAGKGERMKSELPKVLHLVCGKPIISHVLDALREAGVKKIFAVAGYKKDLILSYLGKAEAVVQKRLLGTADALLAARPKLKNFAGTLLVIAGDVPLITGETLKRLVRFHKHSDSLATLLVARAKDPKGYGRILRSRNNRVIKICEETELDETAQDIKEINSGIYCFEAGSLFKYLNRVELNPRKREYYLTDIIGIMVEAGEKISTFLSEDHSEVLGINTRQDLSVATSILKERLIRKMLDSGVTVVDPATTYIEMSVKIGEDTVIFPFTVIEKNVIIGKNCHIGPFCHLREGTVVEDNVELGNFVELVRSKIGKASKAKHLSYLGDTFIGRGVNIGAGTVVANFDGRRKNKTVIESKAFIGSGSILIAPVKIGRGATTGAGAVVTRNKDVPAGKTVVGLPARVLERQERE